MMERDEIIRGLMAAGVPRWKAEQEADRQIADALVQLAPSPFAKLVAEPGGQQAGKTFTSARAAAAFEAEGFTVYRNIPYPIIGAAITPDPAAPIDRVIHWPFRMVLPWSHLVSDNKKWAPAIRGGKPSLVLTVEYRNAKRLAALAGRKGWGDAPPYDGPIALDARVFFPTDTRRHDAHNFQKCAHDALEGIIYANDSQLVPRWIPAGVDVDAPRAELSFYPHPPF